MCWFRFRSSRCVTQSRIHASSQFSSLSSLHALHALHRFHKTTHSDLFQRRVHVERTQKCVNTPLLRMWVPRESFKQGFFVFCCFLMWFYLELFLTGKHFVDSFYTEPLRPRNTRILRLEKVVDSL